MKLSRINQKWWDIANDRRHTLIYKKHGSGKGLTPKEEAEFEMLQAVADVVSNYSMVFFCKLCGKKVGFGDTGYVPMHGCRHMGKRFPKGLLAAARIAFGMARIV